MVAICLKNRSSVLASTLIIGLLCVLFLNFELLMKWTNEIVISRIAPNRSNLSTKDY
uniref:Uncharacterized protein n=1 Tax=Romanomermis culicivorax TaxID=13658 RepID=A0A915HT29_ROMCU